jgi:hypothetical protein
MESAPCAHLGIESAEAGAMLIAYRLAGLSALEGHYAGVRVCAQFGGVWLRGSFLLGVGERSRPPLSFQCSGAPLSPGERLGGWVSSS